MYVGCVDCSKPLNKDNETERPRYARKDGSGWNNTISCCKECLKVWLEKHPEYKRNRK